MNIDNTASQMRKGVLEFCILSIIKLGEAYPSDIIDIMKSANLNILEGTISFTHQVEKRRIFNLPLGRKQ